MGTIKRIGLLVVGWVCIGLGVIGLFLPFMQGFLFILFGLAILSSRSEVIRRFLRHLEDRHPHLHEHVENWKAKVRGWFKKD